VVVGGVATSESAPSEMASDRGGDGVDGGGDGIGGGGVVTGRGVGTSGGA
jgi:hypothetical protein